MIKLDLESFRQRRPNDTITGVIFLELEGEAFPEIGWSDFPLIILGWWIDAQLELSQPKRRQVRWGFMDGPISVTLTKVNVTRSNLTMNIDEISNDLLRAAEQALAHCETQKMLNRDLDGLRIGIRQLGANLINRSSRVDHSSQVEFCRDWKRFR